jgi:hypothetical protein
MPFSLMLETRRAFRRELVRIRSERALSKPFRAALVASEPLYLERAVVPLLKMTRTGLRELLGISGPHGKPSRYFEREDASAPFPSSGRDRLSRSGD